MSTPIANQTMSGAIPEHYVLIDTAIGAIAIAWNERGLTRVRLPESDRNATERRIRAHSARPLVGTPPPWVGALVRDLQHYALGGRVDFASVSVDLDAVDAFCPSVYDAARGIGWGETTTYGELARRIGRP